MLFDGIDVYLRQTCLKYGPLELNRLILEFVLKLNMLKEMPLFSSLQPVLSSQYPLKTISVSDSSISGPWNSISIDRYLQFCPQTQETEIVPN